MSNLFIVESPAKAKTIEKYLGKKDFNALLGEFVIKPTGKPTLVPESDKRPALHSADAAVKDFETIIEE